MDVDFSVVNLHTFVDLCMLYDIDLCRTYTNRDPSTQKLVVKWTSRCFTRCEDRTCTPMQVHASQRVKQLKRTLYSLNTSQRVEQRWSHLRNALVLLVYHSTQCPHTYIHTHTRTCTQTQTHSQTHTQTHTHTHTHEPHACTRTHICTHTHTK